MSVSARRAASSSPARGAVTAVEPHPLAKASTQRLSRRWRSCQLPYHALHCSFCLPPWSCSSEYVKYRMQLQHERDAQRGNRAGLAAHLCAGSRRTGARYRTRRPRPHRSAPRRLHPATPARPERTSPGNWGCAHAAGPHAQRNLADERLGHSEHLTIWDKHKRSTRAWKVLRSQSRAIAARRPITACTCAPHAASARRGPCTMPGLPRAPRLVGAAVVGAAEALQEAGALHARRLPRALLQLGPPPRLALALALCARAGPAVGRHRHAVDAGGAWRPAGTLQARAFGPSLPGPHHAVR